MATKPKANSLVTYVAANNVITFTVLGVGTIPFALTKVSAANRARAEVHGWGQRIVDAAAIPAEPLAEGEEAQAAQRSARARKKFEAMQRVASHYEGGGDSWVLDRVAVAIGLDPVLIAAVMEATGNDEAKVRELVTANATKAGVTERAYLAKLGTGARVAPIVDRMRAAQAGDVDPDAELDGMMAPSEEGDDETTS